MEGNKKNEISKVIFKTRGGTLDIKINKKWKYDDITCVGCDKNIETFDEILNYEGLRYQSEVLTKPAAFGWVFGSSIEKRLMWDRNYKIKCVLNLNPVIPSTVFIADEQQE